MAAKTIDEYLADFPDEQRATMESVRKSAKAAAPSSVETIAWGMPAIRVDGRLVVGYAAFKEHCSFFPMSLKVMDDYKEELGRYDTSKGTIRFPSDKPLPASLVKKMVKARLVENEARGRKR